MKASTRLFFLLILILVTINTLAQNGLEGKKSIYLQLGASGGYSPNLSQPVLIPQLGLDATFGIFGFRANGQFFKTSPEFDINGYLDPIKSVLTISNLQETNSNILLGISPYLSFGKNALSIQPGVGLKYLMQKGATATAVYYQTPGTSILKFPDGDAIRNLFVIEPNIRASFGKPGNFLRFYLEAGYSIPQGSNEYTYTSRSITNVIDINGNVDIKALLNSKQVISKVKTMPAFASIGAGIEIKLFSGKGEEISRSNMTNNYGINDEGLKKIVSQNSISNSDSSSNAFLVGCRHYISVYTWGDGPCSAPPGNGGTVTHSYICANGSYIRCTPMRCTTMNSSDKRIGNKSILDFTITINEGKLQSICNSDDPAVISIYNIYENFMKNNIIGKKLTKDQLDNIQVKINEEINDFSGKSIDISTKNQTEDNQAYPLLANFNLTLRNHAKYSASIDDCVPWHKGWCFILSIGGGGNTAKNLSTQPVLDFIDVNENKNTITFCYDLTNGSEKPRNGTYDCTVPVIEIKDNYYKQTFIYDHDSKNAIPKNTIEKVKIKNNKAYISMRYFNKN
jgi:hypothetical protein